MTARADGSLSPPSSQPARTRPSSTQTPARTRPSSTQTGRTMRPSPSSIQTGKKTMDEDYITFFLCVLKTRQGRKIFPAPPSASLTKRSFNKTSPPQTKNKSYLCSFTLSPLEFYKMFINSPLCLKLQFLFVCAELRTATPPVRPSVTPRWARRRPPYPPGGRWVRMSPPCPPPSTRL